MANKINRNNKDILVEDAKKAIDQMMYEISQEFGIQLASDTASRVKRSVGGEIIKSLVSIVD